MVDGEYPQDPRYSARIVKGGIELPELRHYIEESPRYYLANRLTLSHGESHVGD